MRSAISKHTRDFVAIIVLFVIAMGVGGYILSNQRFFLPKWVPLVGSDYVKYKADFATAQSVTPGQGQTVNIAGVPVGQITKVDLEDGHAVITMSIKRKYTPIYRNATALLRPKTGLNDMLIELTPGSRTAGKLPPSQPIPINQTLPNVNADEILASLDGDTRDYLRLLIAGAGQGLEGNSQNLSAVFKRFDPTGRDILKITKQLAQRRENIRRSIHNFSLLSQALGGKDKELTRLVVSSNQVFKVFASQDAALRRTLALLPSTLQTTNVALAKANRLGKTLGPTLGALLPGARALGPSLVATRPFLKTTTPVIKNQLRPFARDALPTVKLLRPAVRDLADATPKLTTTFKVLNTLFNELTYNPPGNADEGYLFWTAWANHAGATLFATQDAHGPIRHGIVQISCTSLAALQALGQVNQQLGTLVELLNTPPVSQVCPKTSQAGSGTPPSVGTGTTGTTLPSVPTLPTTRARGAR
jgi:phospholipid/cholesterol/gamma-HCH transport system substrate-binding protein